MHMPTHNGNQESIFKFLSMDEYWVPFYYDMPILRYQDFILRYHLLFLYHNIDFKTSILQYQNSIF